MKFILMSLCVLGLNYAQDMDLDEGNLTLGAYIQQRGKSKKYNSLIAANADCN